MATHFLPGESHGLSSLVGYSPWAHTTEVMNPGQRRRLCHLKHVASQNVLTSETHQLGPSYSLLPEVKADRLHLNSAGVSQLHGPTTGNRKPGFQLYPEKHSLFTAELAFCATG